jgi:hypothetical protein
LFQCALEQLDEISISITTNGTQYVAQVPIGFEDGNSLRYSIFVSFGSVPGYGPERKEIVFCVVESDVKTGLHEDIWDGIVLRKKIPNQQHRNLIMSAVCQCVAYLIDEVSPSVLVMVTHTPRLPDKALVKYARVLNTVSEKGYKAGRSDVWNGCYTWMMEQKT